MQIVQLQEFGRYKITGIDPYPFEDARRRLGDMVGVQYDLDGVHLSAKHYVGYIPVTDNLLLEVKPKFVGNNWDLFYLLSRAKITQQAFPVLQTMTRERSIAGRPSEYLLRSFIQSLEDIQRFGLLRRSVLQNEVRTSVRGKVLTGQTLRSLWSTNRRWELACEYYDTTVDIPENRALKQCIEMSLDLPEVPRDIRRQLKQQWRLFETIPLRPKENLVDKIRECLAAERIPDSRGYYSLSLSLCLFILENSTVVFREGEQVTLTAFAINMNSLFERYVLEILRESLRDPDVSIFKGDKSQNKHPLFLDNVEPLITPDVVIKVHGTVQFVGDVKYINRKPNVDELYQILAYAESYQCPVALILPSVGNVETNQLRTRNHTVSIYYINLDDPVSAERMFTTWIRHVARF